MFKFPKKMLHPLSLWYKSFVFYKQFIVKTWLLFFLFSLFSNLLWKTRDIIAPTLNIITNLLLDLSSYLVIFYFCFFSLIFIYSQSENGKALRGKINKNVCQTYSKLIFITFLFYIYIFLPGALIALFISHILLLLPNNWLHAETLILIYNLPSIAFIFVCANFFIFCWLKILLGTSNCGIQESLKMSYHLVKGNFWRNLFALLIPILICCIVFNDLLALCTYAKSKFTNGFLWEFFIVIVKTLYEASLIPLCMSLFLLQFNDLEVRHSNTR